MVEQATSITFALPAAWCRPSAACRRSGCNSPASPACQQQSLRPLAAALDAAQCTGVSWAQRQQSVQHPDPDPTQQSHWHHRQRQHSKALELFRVHRPHFVREARRTATCCSTHGLGGRGEIGYPSGDLAQPLTPEKSIGATGFEPAT